MIRISKKENCCGCNACVQRCPKQCITMHCDGEGFWYPVVNEQECINCGLCEKTCPVLHPKTESKPLKTYAAINKNEDIRLASSSGGIFTILAEETLKQGGVVFGAAFNKKWEVEHIYVENTTELEKLRGSKYVQSNIGNCYKEAEQLLKKGRKVLFSGTPCQIAALKLFLNKDYENLTTIDVVCHGTPSPKVWETYLKENCNKWGVTSTKEIKSISFRDKISGWKNFSLSFLIVNAKNTTKYIHKPLDEDIFMRCFLNNLCLRPSCYACPTRGGKSGSDITLADLWGVWEICPDLDDDKGLSLILAHNYKIKFSTIFYKEIEYNEALKHNPSIEKDVAKPKHRSKFFNLMHKQGVTIATEKYTPKKKCLSIWDKILWNIKHRIFK